MKYQVPQYSLATAPPPLPQYALLQGVVSAAWEAHPLSAEVIYLDEQNTSFSSITNPAARLKVAQSQSLLSVAQPPPTFPGYRPELLPPIHTLLPLPKGPEELFLIWALALRNTEHGATPIHKMVQRMVHMVDHSKTVGQLLFPYYPTPTDLARAIFCVLALKAELEYIRFQGRVALATSLNKSGSHLSPAPEVLQAQGVQDLIITAMGTEAARVSWLDVSSEQAESLLAHTYLLSDVIITKHGQIWRPGKFDVCEALLIRDNKARFQA